MSNYYNAVDAWILVSNQLESGMTHQAIETILALDNPTQQHIVIDLCMFVRQRYIHFALERARDRNLREAISEVYSDMGALDDFNGRINFLSHYHDIKPDKMRELNNTRIRAVVRARAIVLKLDTTYQLAVIVDPALIPILTQTRQYFGVMLSVLEKLFGSLTLMAEEELPSVTIKWGDDLIFTGINEMTLSTLSQIITPYLQALADLQEVISALNDQPMEVPQVIRVVHDRTTLIVEMNGIAEAFQCMKEIINPLLREYDRAKDEPAKTKLSQLVDEMALKIIERSSSNLLGEQRPTYIDRILKILTVLMESPLRLKYVP